VLHYVPNHVKVGSYRDFSCKSSNFVESCRSCHHLTTSNNNISDGNDPFNTYYMDVVVRTSAI